jgi:hypothetical protein
MLKAEGVFGLEKREAFTNDFVDHRTPARTSSPSVIVRGYRGRIAEAKRIFS